MKPKIAKTAQYSVLLIGVKMLKRLKKNTRFKIHRVKTITWGQIYDLKVSLTFHVNPQKLLVCIYTRVQYMQ